MKNLYTLVTTVGHCCILAQAMGSDYNGQEIPSFFAAYMLTKDGKPGCCLEETSDVQRISGNRNTYVELVQFCHGFNEAAQMWRGVRPEDWRHRGTIDPKQIDRLPLHDPELKRLKAWPYEVDETREIPDQHERFRIVAAYLNNQTEDNWRKMVEEANAVPVG